MSRTGSDVIRFIKRYAYPYRAWYGAGMVALLLTNMVSVAIPRFLQLALESVDPDTGDGRVLRWVGIMIGLSVALIIIRTASRMLIFVPGREAEYRLRDDYFRHLLALQPNFYRGMPTGDIMSRGTNDIQFVRVLAGYAGLQVLNLAFALPLNLWMMWEISPWLTLGCVLPLMVAGFVMRAGVQAMFSMVIASQEELAALSDQILESYHGVRVVQDYDAADAVTKRFDRRNNRYRDLQLSIARVRAFLLPIVVVVGNMSILVLLYWGGRMVADSSLHFGAVSAFTVYVANIVMSLTTLGWVVNVIQRGTISLRRILDVLDVEPGLPPVSDELPDGPLDINVSGLGFSYPDSGRAAVLDDVSFSVSAGDSVGIFGSTGSGKTTLLRLMTRLETPPPGTVKIGGVDVRDVDIMQLRAAMSVVPQHAYLFSRSIKDNIFLGDSASENDEEKMIEAVADAALIDDLEVLRDGIDTVVGERGVTLSGGQRQRTSLARAFYRDARILILDDTLSAVDHDTEMRLIGVIFERSAGQTAVIVSHRVSVLRHTDHILVLDEGAVVESGTHDTLLAQGGVYASEWQIHLRHEHHEEERPDAG